jgi:hypothetical protein
MEYEPLTDRQIDLGRLQAWRRNVYAGTRWMFEIIEESEAAQWCNAARWRPNQGWGW